MIEISKKVISTFSLAKEGRLSEKLFTGIKQIFTVLLESSALFS